MSSAEPAPSGPQDDVADLIERLRRTEAMLERAGNGQPIDVPVSPESRNDPGSPADL